jgi:serine/threonine protein kinase
LYNVLLEKYRLREFEAQMLADFLGRILKWEPRERPTAAQMLRHPWLKMQARDDVRVSRRELREYKKVHGYDVSPSKKSSSQHDDQLEEGEERKEDEKGSEHDESYEDVESGSDK